MGTQRYPVEVDRTDSASQAVCRQSWSAVAGHAGCTQWNSVGLGIGLSGANGPRNIRYTRPATAASGSGCEKTSWNASCGSKPGSCKPEGNFNWRRLLSTLLYGSKKGGLAVGPTKRGKGAKIIALAAFQTVLRTRR